MIDKVRQWVKEHAFAPDDIVLGDQGLTDAQLTSLHELLDIVHPDWRDEL